MNQQQFLKILIPDGLTEPMLVGSEVGGFMDLHEHGFEQVHTQRYGKKSFNAWQVKKLYLRTIYRYRALFV